MFSFRNYKWNLRNIPPISVGDGCLASLPTCVQRDRSPPRPLMSFSARNSFWEHRAIFRSSSCKKQYQWDYGLCIFHTLSRSRNSTIILWLLVCSLIASSAGTTVLFWIARVGEWGENREWQWWQHLVFLFSFFRSQTPRGQCNRYKRSCRWRRLAQFSLFTLVYNIYTVYSNGGMKKQLREKKKRKKLMDLIEVYGGQRSLAFELTTAVCALRCLGKCGRRCETVIYI